MESFWAGVIGALFGGLATGLTAWLAFRAERRASAADAEALSRRQLASSLVMSLADFRECRANPSSNALRSREVHSRLDANQALFNGALKSPQDLPVESFVVRVREMIFFARNGWADEENFSRSVGVPILRWAVSDPLYPVAWFESRIRKDDQGFLPEPR